ncbi:MAG TPA: arginase family protein [Actinomycetota bacterium]
MAICVIQVPSHAGDERHPSSAGPRRLIEAGAVALLEDQGHRVTVELATRSGPFRDTAHASAIVNRKVATAVSGAIAADAVPLVLAGSCVTAHGVLAGFDHAACGIVWIDAHGDFNTPQTTDSGFFPGMSLAVITGDCYQNYWARIGDSTPVAGEAIVMFGVRDVSPQAERDRLDRSGIQIVEWLGGRAQSDIVASLDTLARRVGDVYMHIDLDGFAPEVAPGVVDDPVPGGLSIADGEAIVRSTAERFRLRAATLTTYNPELDRGGRTLQLALRLIELIGERAI